LLALRAQESRFGIGSSIIRPVENAPASYIIVRGRQRNKVISWNIAELMISAEFWERGGRCNRCK